MLFTINEGDIVRSTSQPHKVGTVQGWTSNGANTLVVVKYTGDNLSENFDHRSLDLVAAYKPKASKGLIWGTVALFVASVVVASFGVDFAVRAFGWSEKVDWIVSGAVFILLWGFFETKYKNRGRTKLKTRNVTVTKTTK